MQMIWTRCLASMISTQVYGVTENIFNLTLYIFNRYFYWLRKWINKRNNVAIILTHLLLYFYISTKNNARCFFWVVCYMRINHVRSFDLWLCTNTSDNQNDLRSEIKIKILVCKWLTLVQVKYAGALKYCNLEWKCF